MAWWMAIPAVISAANAIYSSGQQRAGANAQSTWGYYNANMRHSTAMSNIKTQTALAMFNAAAARRAGEISAGVSLATSEYNSKMIKLTMQYNDQLLEEEEALLWEKTGLDLTRLHEFRAKERGAIVAQQSASGTVIGTGSNAEVVMDQMTQEAMDAFVISHGADIQAKKIVNARAQSEWQGTMEIKKTLWEGQLGAYTARANAANQASSIAAQGILSGIAGIETAGYQLESDMYAIGMGLNTANLGANNTLTTGLFSAAGQGAMAYFSSQNPGSSLLT